MADINITAKDGGSFSAYVATPASTPSPALVLIQEIFGVNQVMRDLADGFARAGYLAIVPDLFWRQQPGIQLTDRTEAEWSRALDLMKSFNITLGIADLIATVDQARKLEGCNGEAGTIGWCLGGQLAYLMATRSSADCNVGYYGTSIQDHLDEASAITRPLMLHMASEDKFTPPEEQTRIVGELSKIPLATLYRYEGVDHAFARVGGEHFDADAASLADSRTLEFLNNHLHPASKT